MTREQAETIALDALAWLLGDDDLSGVFMNATGLGATDLKARATEPEFLGAVLDFILMDDAWVIACCDARLLAYDALARARAALPGGAQVHWT